MSIDNKKDAENTYGSMKRIIALLFLCSRVFSAYAQTNLEEYFNLCLEFGAPMEVVELFQTFRTYKGENNGSISYVVKEDNSLLKDKPYSEYQIWYTIDKELGLYQSSLIVRGDKPVLQNILTGYLRKFSELYGEPVYTRLENGSLLIFWYSEDTFTVKARLILDIENAYKFVSITYCSPLPKHTQLLRTLYNASPEDETLTEAAEQNESPAAESPAAAAGEAPDENSVSDDDAGAGDTEAPPDESAGDEAEGANTIDQSEIEAQADELQEQ